VIRDTEPVGGEAVVLVGDRHLWTVHQCTHVATYWNELALWIDMHFLRMQNCTAVERLTMLKLWHRSGL
jgi:hypothetical protein